MERKSPTVDMKRKSPTVVMKRKSQLKKWREYPPLRG
jgi:hypothetical protein